MTFVNHFYFYLWDAEWGPAFWKVNCYAPFPVWIRGSPQTVEASS
jgi:hypothetical protein